MDLTGRAVLVTGGKRIGGVVARDLARRGMDVGLSYNRSRAEADATAKDVTDAGRRAFVAAADLTNPDQCHALVDATAAFFGRLDALICMASVYAAVPLDKIDERAWNSVLNVDLRASFFCAQAAIPHMRLNGGGRIITFSDWLAASGRPRYPGYLPYYVAKAGVAALSAALALEVAADQILVNAIAPGPILAPPGTTDEELHSVESATPVGRWGGEEVIVQAVVFLLETDFVTGETIRVDGGRHVR